MSLKELLGEELFGTVIKKAEEGKVKIDIIDEEKYIEKRKYDEVATDNNNLNIKYAELQKQIKERDLQLKELADKAKDNEDVKTAYETLKAKNKEDSERFEKEMKELKFNNAIERSLMSSSAHDIKALLPYIDRSILKINEQDNSIFGLEEQLKNLKTDKAFLFKNTEFKTPEPFMKNDDDKKVNNDGFGSYFAKKKNEQVKAIYDPWAI